MWGATKRPIRAEKDLPHQPKTCAWSITSLVQAWHPTHSRLPPPPEPHLAPRSRDDSSRKPTRGKGTFADTLDGAIATVRNARWRRVICAESLESLSLERNSPPEGRAATS